MSSVRSFSPTVRKSSQATGKWTQSGAFTNGESSAKLTGSKRAPGNPDPSTKAHCVPAKTHTTDIF